MKNLGFGIWGVNNFGIWGVKILGIWDLRGQKFRDLRGQIIRDLRTPHNTPPPPPKDNMALMSQLYSIHWSNPMGKPLLRWRRRVLPQPVSIEHRHSLAGLRHGHPIWEPGHPHVTLESPWYPERPQRLDKSWHHPSTLVEPCHSLFGQWQP